jgi:hypothetical protein
MVDLSLPRQLVLTCNLLVLLLFQSAKQKAIWEAAKAGDKAILEQHLEGATADDLKFERKESWVRIYDVEYE